MHSITIEACCFLFLRTCSIDHIIFEPIQTNKLVLFVHIAHEFATVLKKMDLNEDELEEISFGARLGREVQEGKKTHQNLCQKSEGKIEESDKLSTH